MKLHEKLRLPARGFEREKVTNAQVKSAFPMMMDAADRLEVLEQEHAEFFERWHRERRRREDLEFALATIVDRVSPILEPMLKSVTATSKRRGSY